MINYVCQIRSCVCVCVFFNRNLFLFFNTFLTVSLFLKVALTAAFHWRFAWITVPSSRGNTGKADPGLLTLAKIPHSSECVLASLEKKLLHEGGSGGWWSRVGGHMFVSVFGEVLRCGGWRVGEGYSGPGEALDVTEWSWSLSCTNRINYSQEMKWNCSTLIKEGLWLDSSQKLTVTLVVEEKVA